MRAREKREQELKKQRDEFFNKIRPMVLSKQWKAKATPEPSKMTETAAIEEEEATFAEMPVEVDNNWSDHSGTPVRLVQIEEITDQIYQSNTPVRPVIEAPISMSSPDRSRVLAP
jgi:hypothetical protein